MSTKPLYDFLLDRFTTPDLARFVYFRYPELSRSLPTTTQAEYARALIEQLSTLGLLNDAFFDALKEERGNFAGVIDSLRQRYAQPVAPNGPAQPVTAAPPAATPPTVVFAFLGANPRDTTPLQLDRERLRVEQILGRATHGRQAQVQPFARTSGEMLRDIVRTWKPTVLHFSGHGNDEGLLLLDGPDDTTEELDGEALAEWLDLRPERPRLLVLNACHGARNAVPLARVIDVVIGMTNEVSDAAAMTFSREFYSELGEGLSVEQAFRSARAAVRISHRGEEALLQLNTRPGVRADQIKILG